jgi:predicted  nucleic acid-binding Zn-ribbon protein
MAKVKKIKCMICTDPFQATELLYNEAQHGINVCPECAAPAESRVLEEKIAEFIAKKGMSKKAATQKANELNLEKGVVALLTEIIESDDMDENETTPATLDPHDDFADEDIDLGDDDEDETKPATPEVKPSKVNKKEKEISTMSDNSKQAIKDARTELNAVKAKIAELEAKAAAGKKVTKALATAQEELSAAKAALKELKADSKTSAAPEVETTTPKVRKQKDSAAPAVEATIQETNKTTAKTLRGYISEAKNDIETLKAELETAGGTDKKISKKLTHELLHLENLKAMLKDVKGASSVGAPATPAPVVDNKAALKDARANVREARNAVKELKAQVAADPDNKKLIKKLAAAIETFNACKSTATELKPQKDSAAPKAEKVPRAPKADATIAETFSIELELSGKKLNRAVAEAFFAVKESLKHMKIKPGVSAADIFESNATEQIEASISEMVLRAVKKQLSEQDFNIGRIVRAEKKSIGA